MAMMFTDLPRRQHALTAATLAVLWPAAGSIEIGAARWSEALAHLGDHLPAPTAWVIEAARLDAAWWIAGATSLVLFFLWLGRSRFCTGVSLTAMFVAGLAAALASLALSLPLDQCGLGSGDGSGRCRWLQSDERP